MGKMNTERFRRHGDVYLIESDKSVEEIRRRGKRMDSAILAFGEKTGHKHELEAVEGWERYELDGERYLIVSREGGIKIDHQEHGLGVIAPGVHREVIDREFDYLAEMTRTVQD